MRTTRRRVWGTLSGVAVPPDVEDNGGFCCACERAASPFARYTVAKTCPSCGYQPIGPYIDNCPICAEPVRHAERGGSRRRDSHRPAPAQSSSLQWVIFGGGAVALLALVIAALGGGIGRQRPPAGKELETAVERAKADAEARRKARGRTVTAAQLLQEFRTDPAADQKYRGQELQITGVVERTGKDGSDTPFVVLHGGDEAGILRIECFFDGAEPGDERKLSLLEKGRAVTIRGDYDGRVSNLQFRECVLVK